MKLISIAGSAGRQDDGFKLTAKNYREAQETLLALIQKIRTPDEPIHLVSGGAAYMDHLAVRLFLAGHADKLTLHLPCAWDKTNQRLHDTGKYDWKTNPGGTANALHRKFQAKTGIDSFRELAKAIASPNCTTTVSKGFHARNELMAESHALVALTFGINHIVKDGGTAHTCRTYLERVRNARLPDESWHIPLGRRPMEPFAGIQLV